MGIRIICVGKDKDDYVKLASDEYLRRIRAFIPIDTVIVKDTKLTKTNNTSIVKQKEGNHITQNLDQLSYTTTKKPFIIALDALGKQYDSVTFARKIELEKNGKEIVFVIGGPYGIDDEVKKKSDIIISLSPLTFTHQMTRIILLEQIYRAFTIITGKKYHY